MHQKIQEHNEKLKPLKEMELFVLDNSLRESTVAQLRGHTIENKWKIYEEVSHVVFLMGTKWKLRAGPGKEYQLVSLWFTSYTFWCPHSSITLLDLFYLLCSSIPYRPLVSTLPYSNTIYSYSRSVTRFFRTLQREVRSNEETEQTRPGAQVSGVGGEGSCLKLYFWDCVLKNWVFLKLLIFNFFSNNVLYFCNFFIVTILDVTIKKKVGRKL